MTDAAHGRPILERRSGMTLDPADPHYIVLSHIYTWMETKALAAASGKMLDFGCGGQPYRAMFEGKGVSYIGADVTAAPGVSLDIILTPDAPVPLAEGSVDTVLSSQTLEHVGDPAGYLNECRRVLRPGGVLILTAPMQWRHHEAPYDYYRFTRHGLELLLKRAGFDEAAIEPTGGVIALIAQIALNALAVRGRAGPRLTSVINRLALWLDRKYFDPDDTINWMCLAQRR